MAISVTVASDPLGVTHHRALATSKAIFTPTVGITISAIHNNGIICIATDAIVMTLPLVSSLDPGFNVTFVAHAAAGALLLTVTSNAADAIWGTIVNNAGAGAVFTSNGTANNSIKLTKATQKVDDWVQIVSNGLTDWMIIGGAGIWTN